MTERMSRPGGISEAAHEPVSSGTTKSISEHACIAGPDALATAASNGQHPHKQHNAADVGIAELLEALNYRDDEFAAVCHQKPGGVFRASVMPPNVVPRYVAALGGTVDVWFSVNPTAGPARADCGRGTAEQTTRLSALYIDLDVK